VVLGFLLSNLINMDSKLKHLEFIQGTINRMAGNSFLLKGWTVTLVGGLLALSYKEMNWQYLIVSAAVLVFMWLLDGYYLSQERSFIKLYEHVSHLKGETDFSMKTGPHRGGIRWHRCAFSHTLLIFYGGLALVLLLVFVNISNVFVWQQQRDKSSTASTTTEIAGAREQSAASVQLKGTSQLQTMIGKP
jgi:hypothetical protein